MNTVKSQRMIVNFIKGGVSSIGERLLSTAKQVQPSL